MMYPFVRAWLLLPWHDGTGPHRPSRQDSTGIRRRTTLGQGLTYARLMPRRPSSPPRSGRRESAGWDPFADWYRGWVCELGSEHHRRLAIPAVLSLLDLRTGDRVLDIGAGHGVLAGYVLDEGASYTGVDLSPRLIEAARRTYGKSARFYVADAADLRSVTELRPESFDAAVFLLSIQDIEELDRAIASTAGLLVPGGRLVILMTHPSFRIPRQSGWGWDEGRKLRYRRVDRYLTALAVPMKSYGTDRHGATR